MAKKILMSVEMRCDKCKSKAFKIVAEADGVSYVGLEGEREDQVAVVGEKVDAAALALRLRKKVGPTRIISITPLNPPS